MVPQPPKSISILSHIFLTTFHNSDCISLISSISSDRMNLELLATLAIWLMLLPTADICRNNSARFSGGRGFTSRPRMSCRISGSIFRPVVSDSRLRWAYSCSFKRTKTAFPRLRVVQSSPLKAYQNRGVLGGIPLTSSHLASQMLYLQRHRSTLRCLSPSGRFPNLSSLFLRDFFLSPGF